jgi:hypothetical protein
MVADVCDRAFQAMLDVLAIDGADSALPHVADSRKLLQHNKTAFQMDVTNGKDTSTLGNRIAIAHDLVTRIHLCATEAVKGSSTPAANAVMVETSRLLTGGLTYHTTLTACKADGTDYDDVINKVQKPLTRTHANKASL